MNKLIDLGENEFRKSILKMTISEKESLLRLLFREISLENEQINQYKEIIKQSKNQGNISESSRYEQRIKDTELSVETLERKLSICQKEIDSNKLFKKPDQVVFAKIDQEKKSESLFQHEKSADVNSSNHEDSFSILVNTKSLINNFEKKGNTNTDASTLLRSKKDGTNNMTSKIVNKSRLSLPTWKSSKSEDKIEESPIHFTNIKLKKVGLPPDAKENESSNVVNDKPIVSTVPNNQIRKGSLSNGIVLLPKSISVDFGSSSPLSAKDKFHNPNKDIRVAIQNEMKELKLKKTNNNSVNSSVNCSIDNISLGRYNFINEKTFINSSATSSNTISTSKSMPFLNSIVMNNNNKLNEIRLESTQESLVVDEENFQSDGDILTVFEASTFQNWDPTWILEQLYEFEKELNEVQYPSRNNAKNITGFIEILPGLSAVNNNLWKRRYATISNGELKIFENQSSCSAISVFEVKNIYTQKVNDEILELCDSKGVHSTIRFSKSTDCLQWIDALKSHSYYQSSEIIPRLYDSVTSKDMPKILVVDIGSCSIRAGLLKSEPTLPKIYFPNIAAISKKSNDVVEVGFEAVNPNLCEDCIVIRPLKPDTTIENIAFTSGTIEFTFKKVCSMLSINPKEYVIMLSLPHNVAEATRTKLADVLIFRLNFKGVSMCGQSLLALHAYGEPTGVLVDIGHRTEILPVIHGIVQNASIMRSLYGGHLIQIALSHLLPFKLISLTDFLLARYIMEKSCIVAENSTVAETFSEKYCINFENFKLPSPIPNSLSISGKDRCLPVEGFFNPDIYSLDILSLPKLIFKSIQSCPVDNRRDLYQSICLSGAATQFPGFCNRLEMELKKLLPKSCEVKIHSSPNRAHFSYVGACFVALSNNFSNTIVERREWEEARNVALKKWHL